jgi:hypothetical protein
LYAKAPKYLSPDYSISFKKEKPPPEKEQAVLHLLSDTDVPLSSPGAYHSALK